MTDTKLAEIKVWPKDDGGIEWRCSACPEGWHVAPGGPQLMATRLGVALQQHLELRHGKKVAP